MWEIAVSACFVIALGLLAGVIFAPKNRLAWTVAFAITVLILLSLIVAGSDRLRDTPPVELATGETAWAVIVDGHEEVWNLAVESVEEFPEVEWLGREILYKGQVYRLVGGPWEGPGMRVRTVR